MKWFLMLLLALLLVAVVANGMLLDNGYILISYGDTTFETTLWMGLALIVVVFAVLWLLKMLLLLVLSSMNLVVPITANSRSRRARRNSSKGILNLLKGNWKVAHRQLARAANEGESPLVNYIAAARAAHEIGDEPLAGEYLRRADEAVPSAGIAVGITQAQLHLSGGQLEQALAALKALRRKMPRHPYVLKLLMRTYYRLHDWSNLEKLLPVLSKYKLVDEKDIRKLQSEAYQHLFEQAFQRGRKEQDATVRLRDVDAVWDLLNRQQKQDEVLVHHCARCLIRLKAWDRTEQLLVKSLKKRYSDRLVELYGKIQSTNPSRQLKFAESLNVEYPDHAQLLTALGRICLLNELWGKAREYFEQSLKISRSTVVCNELGQLLAQLGEHQASTEYFREGIQLATRR